MKSLLNVSTLAKILSMGLALVPLALWPWPARAPLELQKVHYLLVLIEVFTVVLAISALMNSQVRRQLWQKLQSSWKTRLAFSLAVLAGVVVLSAVLGGDLARSVVGNYYRGDGIITFLHLIWLSFLVFLVYQPMTERWLWRAVGVSSTMVSALAVGRSLWWLIQGGQWFGEWQGAQPGVFGQPQFLAGFLVVIAPLLWWLSQQSKTKERYFWLGGLVLTVMAIITTLSRAGTLGLVVGLVVIIGLQYRPAWFQSGRVLVFGVVAMVAGLLGWLGIQYWWPPADFYPESRARIFIRVIEGVSQRPLTGWGWARTDAAFSAGTWPMVVTHDIYVDKAHSHVFEYLATTGVVGLLVYAWVVVEVWRAHARATTSPPFALSLLLLFVFHSQLNIISISEEMLFWIVVGLALNRGLLPRQKLSSNR